MGVYFAHGSPRHSSVQTGKKLAVLCKEQPNSKTAGHNETFVTQARLQSSEAAPNRHIFRGHTMIFRLRYCAITLMLLIALSFTFERQAHAYVDPGSGLLIFQGISAVVSGALIYFRRRIKNLFTRTQPTTTTAIQPPAVSSATDQR